MSDRNLVSGEVRERLVLLIKALVIIAAAKWIYTPVLHGDWLWDDDFDITGNSIIRSASGLWSIWFKPGSQIDYYPVKSSVQWVQWHVWGYDTLGYHITNLVLHMVNALLVWRLLDKLKIRLAWLGGLLFAIHPTMVESVAWIAELKNTLSLPPFLLTLIFYIDYDENRKKSDYFLAWAFFLVAMLCKPTMVAFPVVILLYAWWKRNQISYRDIGDSLPFFVVSLGLGISTILVGKWYNENGHAAIDSTATGGFLSRMAITGLSIAFYFSKVVCPVDLMPIYPQWSVVPPSLIQFLPWPFLLGILYWLYRKRKSWGRHALFGLGFFLITLAPFITINVGTYMAFTWVMDHFLYIPIIGLIGLTVAALGHIADKLSPLFRKVETGIVATILVLLIWESHAYAGNFINQETLWSYELQSNPDAWLARINLGNLLARTGHIPEAIYQYEKVLPSGHAEADTRCSLGYAQLKIGRVSEAIAQFQQVLKIKPDYLQAQDGLGDALLRAGHLSEAITQYQEALRNNPDSFESHYDLGNAYLQSGHAPEAMDQYEQALKINPDYAVAHNNLAKLLLDRGQLKEAVEHYVDALQLSPDFADAHFGLGNALIQARQWEEARDQLVAAVRLAPNDADMRNSLGIALAGMGQLSDAKDQFQLAVQLQPDSVSAHTNLAHALEDSGQVAEAVSQYEAVLRYDPSNGAAQARLARLNERAESKR